MSEPKKVVLDATTLTTLMSCGRLADFRFNHHLQPAFGKSKSLEMGSIVHTYLETYYRFIIEGKKREESHGFGLAMAQDYIQKEVKNTEIEDCELAIATCNQYYEHYKNDFWVPLEVEVSKGRVIYEDENMVILWKAKFDLLSDTNQGIYSIDHKTMFMRRDITSINNQFMGQCILTNQKMMIVNRIGFQKSLKPNEKFTRVPVSYTQDRLEEWRTQILPYWASLMLMYNESGYWPPNFTHCENKYGKCQFEGICSVDRNMRQTALGMEFVVGEPWDI